jgi:hypothetical protein
MIERFIYLFLFIEHKARQTIYEIIKIRDVSDGRCRCGGGRQGKRW